MNKDEQEAREICAWCNFVKECCDCPHRNWPDGEWLIKPRFNWKKCKEWEYYLKSPIKTFLGKVLCWMAEYIPWCQRLHKWYMHTEGFIEVRRTCQRCNGYQIYISNKDYTFGRWGVTQYNG